MSMNEDSEEQSNNNEQLKGLSSLTTKIDWKTKLSSRKFWLAVAGFVVGIVQLCMNPTNVTSQVSGLVMSLGSIVAYIVSEGLTDAASVKSNTYNRQDIVQSSYTEHDSDK